MDPLEDGTVSPLEPGSAVCVPLGGGLHQELCDNSWLCPLSTLRATDSVLPGKTGYCAM